MDLKKYIQKKDKTYIIFDFDETIAMLLLPWSDYAKDVKDPIIKKEPELKGKGYAHIHNDYVQKQGNKALNHIRRLNEKFETEKIKGLKVNIEIVAFIASNPEYNYYIWSSNSKKAVVKALKQLKIFKHFKKIITRDETTYIKPEPDGFSFIRERNIPLKNYLLVGNSIFDKRAAKKVGIDFYKV